MNAKLARDFNDRNTTLSFGLALASDTIDPVGGSPVPLAPMLEQGNSANKRGSESKDVTDFLLGVTQVLNRKTLVQLNYSLSNSDGYLTDPYKVLSVVDPVTGNLVPGPAGSGLYRYLYESRPDTREKQSLFGLIKRDIGGNVLEASYRYMTDDWGIDSHTIDVHFRWNFDGGSYLAAARAVLLAERSRLLSHRAVQRSARAAVRDGGLPARQLRRAHVRREVRS